ncbi:adenylate/guanylate cyclase domain-containing protein [Chryseobacterium luteum]|uniref:adenylate/guanylate cyclase domain-containing protein n=1 Tax=Chryseobacterium luteum TaxID=421531 RepID=UPI000A3DB379|nr:adenylate/guanylate cyclase domain-containing protein [Chryseobacterium luteum]
MSLSKTDDDRIDDNKKLFSAYYLAKNMDSAIVYASNMIPLLEKKNDVNRQGEIHLVLAELYLTKADFKSLDVHLKKGEDLLKNSTNYNSKAMLNHMFAMSNIYKKNNDEAAKYFQKNLKYYKDGKDISKHFVMFAYQGLFSNSYTQSKFNDTYGAANTYVDFVKKYYPANLNQAYQILGSFYIGTKNHDKAIDSFKKSIEFTDKKNQDQINGTYSLLALCYEDKKELDSAKYYLDKSYAYFKDSNSPNLATIYYGFALLSKHDKNYTLAEDYIHKALKFMPSQDLASTKFTYQTILHDIQLAKLLSENDKSVNKDELTALLNELNAESEYIKSTNTYIVPQIIIQNYQNLSKIHEKLGNYEQALIFHKKYIEENEKIYGLDKMKELSALQSQTELASERTRIKLEEETKRIQLQKEMELKALRFEFEKKQAAAKTDEERKRLALEEDLKRKEIQFKFDQEQQAVLLKYNQEKNIARINQEKKDAIAKADLESSKTQKNMWAVGAGLSLLLLGFAGFSYNQKRKDNKKIAEEKLKSDQLLLNILPHEVAEELKEKGKTSAKHFDEVSVLFTDFVNFTANSERIGVQEVLNELNICFTEFDRLMEKYGLEKIKTIGDAYLAVSGLPLSNGRHAKNAVAASLEILSYIQHRKQENPNALDIRIGIHSGPVIAGIVGVKKFAYDIWGDTVNTAARMEQNSVPGRVNISEATYQLIKQDFTFEHRGKIETKGKGAMEMYFVNQTPI